MPGRSIEGMEASNSHRFDIGLVIEHPSAADDISLIGITSSVIAAAENWHFFDNVNVFSKESQTP